MTTRAKRVTSGSASHYVGRWKARRRLDVLNRFDRSPPMAGEAEVKYLDGDFRVLGKAQLPLVR